MKINLTKPISRRPFQKSTSYWQTITRNSISDIVMIAVWQPVWDTVWDAVQKVWFEVRDFVSR